MRTITSALLRERGACKIQIDLFMSLDGDRLELTEAVCVEHAQKFDWDWASKNLLAEGALAEYLRVEQAEWAEYLRIQRPAWAEYQHIEQLAQAKYVCVPQPVWAEYLRTQRPALAEYKRVQQAACAKYRRVCASAFFHAWNSAENQIEDGAEYL
jgi:hypothetical protein